MMTESLNLSSRLFLTSMFITNIGNGIYILSMSKEIFDRTNSILGFGLILICEFIFKILLQFYAGAISDRYSALKICISSDISRGLCLLISAVLAYHGHFFAALVLSSIAINLFKPFYIAAAFVFAKHSNSDAQLERYNSAFVSSKQGGYLLGLTLAGFVIEHLNPTSIFLLNAISYFISISILFFAREGHFHEHDQLAKPSEKIWQQISASYQELRLNTKHVRRLLLACFDPVCLYFLNIITVPLVAHYFFGDAHVLSLLQAAFVLGMTISTYLFKFPFMSKIFTNKFSVISLGLIQAALIFGIYLSGVISISAILIFILGAVNTYSFSLHYSRFMRGVSRNLSGRLSSFYMFAQSLVLLAFLPSVSHLNSIDIKYSFMLMVIFCILQFILSAKWHELDAKVQS